MTQTSEDANYQGGPFDGTHESRESVTLPSGATFEKGDLFDAVVAALRTVDIVSYDRTFHKLHDPVEIPFDAQRGRPTMSAWYYDAGGMKVRIVVNYTAGLGKVDRLDVYGDGTTVRPGVPEGLTRNASETVDQYRRRRAAGQYIRDI
jgi:hypothetical protein